MNSSELPDFGPWDDLTMHPEFKPSPGIPLDIAIGRLAIWEGEQAAQKVAIGYLRSGIWSSQFQRAFQRVGLIGGLAEDKSDELLLALKDSWGSKKRHYSHGAAYLSPEFWHTVHETAGDEWKWEPSYVWPDGARIDSKRGLVESFIGFGADTGNDFDFVGVHLTAFGVEINEDDVEATAPPQATAIERASRPTTYNWEAAFADIAAAFYHHTEFENLDARGVQSQIVRMLQDAFEARGLEVPAADTCKLKARMLLGSLRGQKPK